MGCGTTLVKCILIIANVFFALAGVGLAGVGATVLVFHMQETLASKQMEAVAIATIVVGAVTFIVAFFGCCGTIFENKGMLASYSVLLIILMNVKTALATMLLVGVESLTEAVKREFQRVYYTNQAVYTDIERTLECCGTTGASSYLGRPLPAYCCTSSPCSPDNSHSGCFELAKQMAEGCSFGVSGLCLILVAVELLVVVFSLCLINHVNNKYKGRY